MAQKDKTRSAFDKYGWFIFALLIVFEYLIFRSFVVNEIAPFYPTSHDQTSYLQMTYRLYDLMLKEGVFAGLRNALSQPAATGMFMPIQGALFFMLAGASRLSALTTNFIYFALLQFFVILTARSIWRGWTWPAIATGFILGLGTPFFGVGDLTDYRMDFLALCLFGIVISTVVASRVFEERRWALLGGVLAGFLILLRFLTAVYLAGIYGFVLGFLLVRYWMKKQPKESLARMKNLLWSGASSLIIAVPFLVNNRQAIFNYYVVNHFLNSEKAVRAAEQGVNSLFGHLAFYPISLLKHIGIVGLFLIALLGIAAIASRYGKNHTYRPEVHLPVGETLAFLGASVVIPIVMLTADMSKSPIVVSIVLIPLLWGIIIIAFQLCTTPKVGGSSGFDQRIISIFAALALAAGLIHYTINMTDRRPLYDRRADADTIKAMYLDIGNYAERQGLKTVNVFFATETLDFFGPQVFVTIYYEEEHRLIDADLMVGGVANTPSFKNIEPLLRKSSFVVVDGMLGRTSLLFPFDKAMAANLPQIKALLDKQFVRFGSYYAFGRSIDVYVKRGTTPSDKP
ncbi:MAG: hypothetical protein M1548_01905 [Actinobacteria bacterium]|nr:hypothetical protein [Actinomycetota bacterium]